MFMCGMGSIDDLKDLGLIDDDEGNVLPVPQGMGARFLFKATIEGGERFIIGFRLSKSHISTYRERSLKVITPNWAPPTVMAMIAAQKPRTVVKAENPNKKCGNPSTLATNDSGFLSPPTVAKGSRKPPRPVATPAK